MNDTAISNEIDIEEIGETIDSNGKPLVSKTQLKPWLFQPGKSGNPSGRPKGKTMKEWTREFLAAMSDEERYAFLSGMPKTDVWRMAEGLPDAKQEITHKVPQPILGGITQDTQRIDGDTNTQPS